MRDQLTAEEARLLRREIRGAGNLARLGLIEITSKGRGWVQEDDKRIRTERSAGGGTRYIGILKRKQIARAARAARSEKGKGAQ